MTAILESIINPGQSGVFELDPATRMTQRKSDPFDLDMWINNPVSTLGLCSATADGN